MRLLSIRLAGYRSFAARGPSAPERPLQLLQLAPLTILIGKNNSGKSNVARLCHHVLLALGTDGNDPFPMKGNRRSFGASFRDVQHGGNFFNPLDFQLELVSDDGARTTFEARISQQDDFAGDVPPVLEKSIVNGQPGSIRSESLRIEARKLLDASCHLGPVRDAIKPIYPLLSSSRFEFPETDESVAQMLNADGELRTAIGLWTATNLNGWRLDVQQTLDTLKIVARRGGREGNLADFGQGIQHVLPVATLCCWRNLGRGGHPFLDIIEQPELHLHDAAHAPLGDLLLSTVAGSRGNILVETHSESLVLRIRRRIAEGLVSPDQVALLYVEDTAEGSRLQPVQINGDGEVDWWPEGVFSEAFVEVKAIRRAQRKKAAA